MWNGRSTRDVGRLMRTADMKRAKMRIVLLETDAEKLRLLGFCVAPGAITVTAVSEAVASRPDLGNGTRLTVVAAGNLAMGGGLHAGAGDQPGVVGSCGSPRTALS